MLKACTSSLSRRVAKTTTNTARRFLHLSPREVDHLQLHNAGRLAQYRLARGVRLNVPESVALITMQMMEKIRDGEEDVGGFGEAGC